MNATMRAAVVDRPGPPEVLTVRDVPRPRPREGWSLVRVMAAGLNRSELFTRQGHSPGVRFPRVLGIECVGVVAEPSPSGPGAGTTVAAVMGEMGRAFDGGYAQYALLPDRLLMPLSTTLDWETLAALPETYLTAYGSLATFGDANGGALLVRGGTSSVGMAALSLARGRGWTTIATTRDPAKAAALTAGGADHAIVDTGTVADAVRAVYPGGPERVLDLVGPPTLAESLRVAGRGGAVCVTGTLSGTWVMPDFEPVSMIPTGTTLTAFHSDGIAGAAGAAALREIAGGVTDGRYRANLDRVFPLEEIAAAHRYMEENRAAGKVVVRMP